jgi:hypothetical protein
MTILEITERVWHQPRNRKTWAEVRTAVRAASGIRSSVVLSDSVLDECIDRAVDAAWPRCFQHEVWKVSEIEAVPQSINLPWAPFAVFNVYWRDMSATTNSSGAFIPLHMWEIENTSWRWLGADTSWMASTNVLWMMEAVGKPRRMADETVYCPVPLSQIVPLAHVEVAHQIAMQRPSIDPLGQYQALSMVRELARKNTVRMRFPPHQTKVAVNQGTDVLFKHFGQDDVTIADLQ